MMAEKYDLESHIFEQSSKDISSERCEMPSLPSRVEVEKALYGAQYDG